eukprot:GHRQ01023825.1.p1 GENE.GHRQ01023825.1~~GHRQ01023825.1.p1  ORF type:complete len:259 (-),score=75.64 GHRQ01023825.1:10-786(-)
MCLQFYAPWCGHCQQLKPVWEQAAQALRGIVNVAAVDCDEHKSVAGDHGIRGFPTIKFFYVLNGAIKSSDYNGGRSAKELVAFAMDKAKAYAFKQLGEKPPSGSGRASSAGAGAGGDGGFYDGTDVVTLTDGNFEDEVMQSDDIWFVEVRLAARTVRAWSLPLLVQMAAAVLSTAGCLKSLHVLCLKCYYRSTGMPARRRGRYGVPASMSGTNPAIQGCDGASRCCTGTSMQAAMLLSDARLFHFCHSCKPALRSFNC